MKRVTTKLNAFSPLVITLFLLVVTSTQVSAQGLCDAYSLLALKDNYEGIESQTIDDALIEASCETKKDKRGTSVNFLSQYGNLSFGDNRSSLRKACATKDTRFFRDNFRHIMYSHLPKEAFNLLSGCFGGLHLTAEREGSQNVRIRATWVPQLDGELAIVKDLVISDEEALQCKNTSFTKGSILIPAEQSIVCEIRENKDVSITLETTKKGSKGLWIRKEPKIETVLYDWSYVLSEEGSSRSYSCKNQFGVVGAKLRVVRQMERNLDAVLKGSCLIRFGRGKVIIDGVESEVNDEWTYETFPGQRNPRIIQCKVNGRPIGGRAISTIDGTWGNDSAITSLCAGRNGLNRVL